MRQVQDWLHLASAKSGKAEVRTTPLEDDIHRGSRSLQTRRINIYTERLQETAVSPNSRSTDRRRVKGTHRCSMHRL